jgi:hypothetical protein
MLPSAHLAWERFHYALSQFLPFLQKEASMIKMGSAQHPTYRKEL